MSNTPYLRTKLALGALLAIPATLMGCSYPKFTDVIVSPPKQAWVERSATVTSDQSGVVDSKEIVYTTVTPSVVDAEERVIWVSGVDPAKSKLQRSQQRIGQIGDVKNESIGLRGSLVKSYQFMISGDDISVEGRLALKNFQVSQMDRFYVEFLNAGPMSENSVNEAMNAWKKLLPQLKEKGLDSTKVVLGGAKYDQGTTSIILVKVGR